MESLKQSFDSTLLPKVIAAFMTTAVTTLALWSIVSVSGTQIQKEILPLKAQIEMIEAKQKEIDDLKNRIDALDKDAALRASQADRTHKEEFELLHEINKKLDKMVGDKDKKERVKTNGDSSTGGTF